MNLQAQVEPKKRLFTIEEYHKMAETGILGEDERVELIGGEIFEMPPIGPLHASCVDDLNEMLVQQLAGKAKVRVQNPVHLTAHSERYPDIAIVRRREDSYHTENAKAEDVLLIIEVADTTLKSDRETKIPEYAQAGIPEVWLVDLQNKKIEVHHKPLQGDYQTIQKFQKGQEVVSPTVSDFKVKVDDIIK